MSNSTDALDALRTMGGLSAERSLDATPIADHETNHVVAANAILKKASSDEHIPVMRNALATLAQTHATLALEGQMKRIADALEASNKLTMMRA